MRSCDDLVLVGANVIIVFDGTVKITEGVKLLPDIGEGFAVGTA